MLSHKRILWQRYWYIQAESCFMVLHRLLLSILALFTPAKSQKYRKISRRILVCPRRAFTSKRQEAWLQFLLVGRKNVDWCSVSLLHRGFRYDSNTCKTLEVKKSAQGQPPYVTYRPLRRREVVSCLRTQGSAGVAKLLCQRRIQRMSKEELGKSVISTLKQDDEKYPGRFHMEVCPGNLAS